MHEDPDDPRLTENRLDWINSAKDRVVEYNKWRWLRAWGTISSSTGGILYFPDYVWEVTSFYPTSLGYRRPVDIIGGPQYDRAGPAVAAGLSDYAVPWGTYGVQIDPPATGTITCSSAAGAGDQGVQVTIEGKDANDNYLLETVTLDGTGAATTSNSFKGEVDGVRRIWVEYQSLFNADGSERSRGILTCTMGGETLERLDMSRELKHEHQRWELYPTNNSTDFTYRYYRRIPDIVDLDHVFEIPSEFKDTYLDLLKGMIAEFQDGPAGAAPYYGSAAGRMIKLKINEAQEPGRQRGFRPTLRYRRRWRW